MRDVLERLKVERRIAAVLIACALVGFATAQLLISQVGGGPETPPPELAESEKTR